MDEKYKSGEIQNGQIYQKSLSDESLRDNVGFDAATLYEKYNLLLIPVYILSFDKIFLETDMTEGMIFRGRRSEYFISLQWMLTWL